MRPYFYILMIVWFPLLSFSQQWKTFTDTAGMFTAKYPSSWVNKIKEGNRVFFTSPADTEFDGFFENINISVTQKPGYGTKVKIGDFFPAVTNSIKEEIKEFTDEGVRYFKWNNTDAAEYIYSGYNKLDKTFKFRVTQWYCLYKSRLYIVTFVAAAEKNNHNATAQKVMSSIVFK